MKKLSQFFSINPILRKHKLFGRISELQKTFDDILHDLEVVKKSIELHADSSLYILMCSVVDPLVKEMTRMQKTLDLAGTTTHHVKCVSRCVECIEKARVWIELGSESWDEEKVRKVIIKQTVEEFQGRIDRDIQVIQDYLSHAVQDSSQPETARVQMKGQLMPTLSPILHKLYNLRDEQNDLTVDNLIDWRSVADEQREGLFSATLHTIDTFFTQ